MRFCENLSSCVPTLCLHFFCDFNVREYNWKCLFEMSSRKINVKEFSSLKAVEKLAWKTVALCIEYYGWKCKVVSKFKRLQVSQERMHPRRLWGETAFLHPSETWLLSESGLRISRLIMLIVWFTFSGIFFALELFAHAHWGGTSLSEVVLNFIGFLKTWVASFLMRC